MKKSRKARPFGGLSPCLKFLLLMKVSLFLVLVACLQVSANGYSQETFSLHFRQADVPAIFNTIQKESKYKFFYNNDYLKELGKVDLDVTDAPLASILRMVLG